VEHLQTERRRRDGTVFPVLLTISPIYDATGTVAGASTIVRDITERKRIEDERRQLLFEAQRAIKTREDILTIVSHDLKNPLNTMSLVVHLMRGSERLDKEQIIDVTSKIHRAVERMLLLISDLLDFSKIQSGTFSVEPHPETLESIVLPAIDGMKTLVES